MTTVSTVMDSTVSDNPDGAGAGAGAGAGDGERALTPRVGPVEGLRQTFSLAWRTLVQIKHNPAEVIDFSVQPVMFLLLFTFVFGGAIGGSPKAYLMFALPGIMVQNSLFTTLNTATGLSTDLEKGFFDRLRSLPIARFAPAVRPHAGRPGQADLGARHAAGNRVHPRVQGRHQPAGRARRLRPGAGQHAGHLLGAGAGGHARGQPGEGADLRLRGAVPDHVHQRRVRPHRLDAGLAAGLVEGEPGVADLRRRARAHGLRPGRPGRWSSPCSTRWRSRSCSRRSRCGRSSAGCEQGPVRPACPE